MRSAINATMHHAVLVTIHLPIRDRRKELRNQTPFFSILSFSTFFPPSSLPFESVEFDKLEDLYCVLIDTCKYNKFSAPRSSGSRD